MNVLVPNRAPIWEKHRLGLFQHLVGTTLATEQLLRHENNFNEKGEGLAMSRSVFGAVRGTVSRAAIVSFSTAVHIESQNSSNGPDIAKIGGWKTRIR